MPIYEYQCTQCQHQFDVIQKMNDEPIKLCPNCSQQSVVRLVSAAGFQLKGTGWYATDFKDKGKPKPTVTEHSDTQTASADATPSVAKGDSE